MIIYSKAMNDTIEIEINLFGPFRKYGSTLKLFVPNGVTIWELRPLLALEFRTQFPSFSEEGLIHESAIASEEEVLREDAKITNRLALLPPVCGG